MKRCTANCPFNTNIFFMKISIYSIAIKYILVKKIFVWEMSARSVQCMIGRVGRRGFSLYAQLRLCNRSSVAGTSSPFLICAVVFLSPTEQDGHDET